MTPRTLYDHAGRLIRLGGQVGAGGEGIVFDLPDFGGHVAKVYHQPPSLEKGDKLRAMIAIAGQVRPLTAVAAWPVATLHDRLGGPVAGLVMPKVADGKEIHVLYSPAHRKVTFPQADWGFLLEAAASCAEAFAAIHAAGVVIGDVNQSSVFISPQRQARLIDCDSFQFAWNGTTYFCDVGVPLFTPPELQGRNLRGLVRTANHDCFGLAVLIFHLLFMGRHPFSGRYLGKGDMPIETAVAQFRYAYGGDAARTLMQPPPHSLPVTAVTKSVAVLFERAFSPQGATPARPVASEWAGALRGLRGQLTTCRSDAGHLYPGALPACPWCELIASGAPNFFISVAFARGGVASFDLAAVWRDIESVRFLDHQYVPPPLPNAMPRPIPAGVPHTFPPRNRAAKTRNQVVALLSMVVLLVLSLPLLTVVKGLGILLLISAVGFGCWAGVEEFERRRRQRAMDREREIAIRPLRQLIAKRTEALDKVKRELEAAERSLASIHDRRRLAFAAKFEALRKQRAEHERLARQYVEERQRLQHHARSSQLEAFLQQQFVADEKIEGIGKAKLAALGYAGIETAFDVTLEAVMRVTGIGEVLGRRLVDWRRQVESRFIFNAGQGVPAAMQQALDMKYFSLRQGLETALQSGATELKSIVKATEQDLGQQGKFIRSIITRLAQASADVAALPVEIL